MNIYNILLLKMAFDPQTEQLLEFVQIDGKLVKKSEKTGAIYETSPEDTLLFQGTESEIDINKKYKHAIKNIPYDATNPVILTQGCVKCGRKLAKMRRLGENKETVITCLCGNTTSNKH